MHVWKTVKIFISSTFRDLELERDKLALVFRDLQRHTFARRLAIIPYDLRWRQRHHETDLVRWCIDMVEQCDYFVGILGYRYGWRPPQNAVGEDNDERLSITAMEVKKALEVIAPENRFFCLGELTQYERQLVDERKEDISALQHLKEELQRGEDCFCYDNGQQLLAIIARQLRQILDEHYPPEAVLPIEKYTQRQALEEILREKAKGFVGRNEYLDFLDRFALSDDDRNYLGVYAVAGTGKSALAASFIQRWRERHMVPIVWHYMSMGGNSHEVGGIISSIAWQLRELGVLAGELASDFAELREQVVGALDKSSRIVLVVDGLDEISESGNPLAWLPDNLPSSVRVIVTSRPVMPWPQFIQGFSSQILELPPLTEDEIAEIICDYERKCQLSFHLHERELLQQRAAGSPLFLKVSLDEILSSGMAVGQLASSVNVLFEQILQRLAKRYGKTLVERYLGFIAASRDGLPENELQELLAQSARQKIAAITDELLFSLGKSLENFVVRRRNLLRFFHPEFERSIKMRLGKKGMRRYHRYLSVYLVNKGYQYERTLSELAYQTQWAEEYKKLLRLLTDIDYLHAKCQVGMVDELRDDFTRALSEHAVAIDETIAARNFDGITVNRRTIGLLLRALQMDLQFLREFSDKILQVLWNRCYWHGLAPQKLQHHYHVVPQTPRGDAGLSVLVEKWRKRHNGIQLWIKTRRPLAHDLESSLWKTLRGHRNWVLCIDHHPFRAEVASGGGLADLKVRLWDVVRGEGRMILKGHTSGVYALRYSPDGHQIVSGSRDGTIRVWDSETGECLRVLQAHEEGTMAVDYHPHGQYIASGGRDHAIRIWEDDECIATLIGHSNWVQTVRFSPQGNLLASTSRDSTVKIWDVDAQKCLHTLAEHKAEVWDAAYDRTGEYLVTCSRDQTLRIWQANTGECTQVIEGYGSSITSANFSHDNRYLIFCTGDGAIHIWDFSQHQHLHTLRGHHGEVYGIACSPEDQYIASCSLDKTVCIWGLKIKTSPKLHGHAGKVRAFASSRDGSMLFSGGWDKNIAIWDTHSGQRLRELVGHTGRIGYLRYSTRHDLIISGASDRTVRLWNARSGECIRILKGHRASVVHLDIDAGERRVASASKDKSIRVWDIASGECLTTLSGHKDWVDAVAFGKGDSLLASASRDTDVRLWNPTNGECIAVLRGHKRWVRHVSFNRDGTMLASGGSDKMIRIWQVADGKCVHICKGHRHHISRVYFTCEDRQLVSWAWDGTVRFWDVATGQCIRELMGKSDLYNLAKADTRYALVSHTLKTIVYDKTSWQIVAAWPGHIDEVAYFADGTIIGGSGTGYVFTLQLVER